MVPAIAGIAAIILLLIAMGRANNGSWGPSVLLFLAGMSTLVFGSYSQIVLFELSLPAAGILFFLSCVGLVALLHLVAVKDHEWLAIMGGLICCLMLAQCANRLLPMPF
ncbi:hypothetical protein KKC06_02300 [Patescibacteria group bacterium]|nr:hypothetical protein [Patescibacteria group bacterium]